MTPILLSTDVYSCVANDHVVFLDLRRDAYSCLDRDASRVVAKMLYRSENENSALKWNESNDAQHDCGGGNPGDLIEPLLKQRLVTLDRAKGRVAIRASINPPEQSLLPNIFCAGGGLALVNRSASIRSSEKCVVARFFMSALWAAFQLRNLPIQRIVENARQRSAANRRTSSPPNISRIRELTQRFTELRPLFPRSYLCLFDSLALVHFLARSGLFPTWVFAVKMDPFTAHCWVQESAIVLNDKVEYCRDFTPIMAI